MKQWVSILALALTLPVCAGLIPNGDFENSLTGWQVVPAGGATAIATTDHPAAGRASLLLKGTGADRVWVLGPVLPGAPGELRQITFSARRADGQAKLLLSLVGDATALAGVPTWEAVLPLDDQWHKVSLLIRVPAVAGGTPHLAFGLVGPAGAWALDDVDAQPGKAPTFAPLPPAAVAGEIPQTEVLPADWKPEGLLDATSKEIVGKQELILNVNGVEVGMEQNFTCRRGQRDTMIVFASNRGQMAKDLRVAIAAPEGITAPVWTLPIRAQGTTTFRIAIQSLHLGDYWAKLTVTSANDTASAPIRLTCTPCYPDVGAVWREPATADEVKALQRVGVDLHVLCAPPDSAALQPMVQALAGRNCELVIAPLLANLPALQYPAAVSKLFDSFKPSFWAGPPDDPNLASLSVLSRVVMDLRKRQPDSGFASPPVLLTRDWQKGRLEPAAAAQLTPDKMAGMVSLSVRPPALPAPCVLHEEVDGKADVVSGALCGLIRQTNLGYLRELLSQRRVNLPLLVGDIQAAPGGDDRLTALYLARAMTEAVSQGATGVVLSAHPTATNAWGLLPSAPQTAETPMQQVVRLLAGELTGAVPLVPLADTPGVSSDPESTVGYRPFLRGGEGIVVLWNNTSAPRDVTVEFRAEPVVHQRLFFSYQGDFAVRRWDPIMQFPEEAFKRGQPAIYVRLDPLQVQVHTFRLLQPNWTWLRKVELTAPFKPPTPDVVMPSREERTWWKDVMGGRGR
jgi:hypothetical protein